jgi:hypothetical protein
MQYIAFNVYIYNKKKSNKICIMLQVMWPQNILDEFILLSNDQGHFL